MAVRPRPRTPLSRERVIAAAVTVADDHGVASVSMRKIAERLGVEAMSLYHHVPDKDAVVAGILDAVLEEIDLPEAGPDWRTAMRRRAISTRDALARHSWALGLIESRGSPGSATLRRHDAALGTLLSAGFAVDDAVHAVALLDSYVYGFVLQQLQLPVASPPEARRAAADLLGRLPDDLPHLRAVAASRAAGDHPTADDEFRFGLDVILDALDRSLAPADHPPTAEPHP
ncbi:TetR/AcrR family transcriptional regulator C-terminal domain-containing protein [Cellulomonas carbonis]|uniref:AcrR family transcriptional regulator n=1 Tax=Cellulomonas carbonis T26 TaxID=947969 RepID=A0A0A0BW42_9CELL|nr:TetR/AcrR family transcriptional regulator C-terminal domain-containing protein [Cellulomonas carbonis]KGM12613.1 AcrR family transcriptional regulator [Cellulomonas carbonis T26]GGC05959.1 TetR family transcriptional regulator [Cellulomonas carbonis]